MPFWLDNGGAQTLRSYGVAAEDPDAWDAVPEDHLEMLRQLPLQHRVGDYLFVHAGVRPGIPLERQDPLT
ncbi:hypothetical protein ACFQU2_26110 [Siccirubricoccus deserti]